MNSNLQHIADNFDRLKIKPEDTFKFHCTQCGKCCTHREDILLSPQDLFRVAKHLGQRPVDVVQHYCEWYTGRTSRMPVVRLLPEGDDAHCPFLVRNKCRIHDAKPAVCAMFPLGRARRFDTKTHKPSETINYIFTSPGCGDESETHTVKEWLESFNIPVDDSFYMEWSASLADFSQAMQKLEKHPLVALGLIGPALFDHLYLMYDIGKEFIPQFQKNVEETKEFLQSLLAHDNK